MRYWMERKTDFAVNEIDFKRVDTQIDRGLFDAQMDFLRPKAFHLFVDDSSWSEDGSHRELQHLLSRESLRNSIQTCTLFADCNVPPAVNWILGATGYRNYEVHDFNVAGCFPADWFDSFIDVP
ncbi:hypothetical protein AAVH_37400 [Aphelenchoides avenae]|nr:hypothetical protein AAVH_37400 [Aphelenchus avenae]